MFSTSPDPPQKSTLQIKQDDKFFSRLLSKENSVANPSFRVYYGGVPGAVPFMWESQPGTPKYTFSDTSLPPLTPPPSYYAKSCSKTIKKHSRSSLMHALFQKMISLKKIAVTSPSSSSLSSSLFSLSTSSMSYQRRNGFSTPGSSFDSGEDDEEAAAIGSPTSTLCFAIGKGSIGKLRGCYGW
ncbi:uncharacterized protein LOC110422021 [Herrania umbratica]|uniref:Uncharacterized protein LOC110422021 n=1 Tax=Herrania umbratica TaxID=108875 RepID=A0A6J1AW87_9ROSI|nr:uncharacterized protein LOC110422021 [Herrania umbratica]